MTDYAHIVIAGPGAGKTFNLVQKIIDILPNLHDEPYKFCAVITYTNAATEEIKNRLISKTSIYPNVFIGTTHSFLIKFVIEPYAHLFNVLPKEKFYIDRIGLNYKPKNSFAKRNAEINKADQLSKIGLVTFDKILDISYRLILENKNISKLIANRIKYIFVDEYQDIRLYQHEILEKITSHQSTQLECIGDPLQSIFKFAYNQSQIKNELKPQKFVDTPLMKLYSVSVKKQLIKENYRSTKSIVGLINNYTKNLNFELEEQTTIDYPIFFINKIGQRLIIDEFFTIIDDYKIEKEENKIYKLILAEERRIFDDVKKEISLIELDKGNYKTTTIMQEAIRCVLSSLGMNLSEVMRILFAKYKKLPMLIFRWFCFDILSEMIIRKNLITSKCIRDRFEKISDYKFNYDWDHKDLPLNFVSVESSIRQLISAKYNEFNSVQNVYSTIHSAKGLEATCVLVIAQTINQLKNWLNFEKVLGDKDTTRLGYVAFSRARKLLCIACLEKIDEKYNQYLTDTLNFHIYH